MIGYKVRMVNYYESGEKPIPLSISRIKHYSELSEEQFKEITALKYENKKLLKKIKRLEGAKK